MKKLTIISLGLVLLFSCSGSTSELEATRNTRDGIIPFGTAGNFMAKTAENLNPAFDLLRSIPFADTLKSVLGKKELEEKKAETTEFEEVK